MICMLVLIQPLHLFILRRHYLQREAMHFHRPLDSWLALNNFRITSNPDKVLTLKAILPVTAQ